MSWNVYLNNSQHIIPIFLWLTILFLPVYLDHNGMSHLKINFGRSRWPCGLRRRSERIWLLGSRVSNSVEVTDVRLLLDAFAKLRKATMSFVMSVRPRGATRLLLDGFSWSFILEDFSKICKKNIQVSLKYDKYSR